MEKVAKGIIILASNQILPRNYAANSLPFRQDSTMLYFTGIDSPDIFVVLDCESGDAWLIGNEPTVEDAIWSGHQSGLKELAESTGINKTLSVDDLKEKINRYKVENRTIHFLPPYTAGRIHLLSKMLEITHEEVKSGASEELIRAVIEQRSVKSEAEIAEIESALNEVTGPMHVMAMGMAVEGCYEHQIAAEIYRNVKAKDLEFAYPVICSVRGEVLHNESHRNQLKKGQLLLIDAGAESYNHYASDITRTSPVGGKFSTQQREIYEIVLTAQLKAIQALKPGVRYMDIHIEAARNITRGLIVLGIMRGNEEEAVSAGAHALFFPHGLGHMLGLDVHDMEDLGENLVGYDEFTSRSNQFGTAYLRLAKELRPGFVLTVEPGIYFIPPLIEQWHSRKKFDQFINYESLNSYLQFGGVRIEDNVVITESGCKILGKPIIKTIADIEALS